MVNVLAILISFVLGILLGFAACFKYMYDTFSELEED